VKGPTDSGSSDGAGGELVDGGVGDDALRTDVMPPPVDAALQGRIDDAVASIHGDTCFAQADASACEWAHYEVGPAWFNMARSTGEAALIIDAFGAGFFPELVRYRNRLLGFYVPSGDKIEPQVLSVLLPRRLGDVLVSFAGPEFVPASALLRVALEADAAYGKLDLFYPGHGGVVFGHLVDLVPEQPLVLLDSTHLLDIPPEVCSGIDAQTLATATAHFSALAASMKQMMSDREVRFVNASFGLTVPVLAAEWQRGCSGAVPGDEELRQLLHIYDPLFDLLFDTEGVITAHAAADLGNPADFPFDQVGPQYPNRVRVGFISSSSSGLDELGRGAVRKKEQFPDNGDADVYLNWDCEWLDVCAEPHYTMASAFGLAAGNLPVMSTSYIDPLAVARLVNLRYANHGGEPMSNTLVRVLERELIPALCGPDGTEPCVYQDPIAHRQLEVYRLGYQ
jgi:hypothetical protein